MVVVLGPVCASLAASCCLSDSDLDLEGSEGRSEDFLGYGLKGEGVMWSW